MKRRKHRRRKTKRPWKCCTCRFVWGPSLECHNLYHNFAPYTEIAAYGMLTSALPLKVAGVSVAGRVIAGILAVLRMHGQAQSVQGL